MITDKEITCQLKFLEKIVEKILFLQILLTNLQKKIHIIWEFLVTILHKSEYTNKKKEVQDNFTSYYNFTLK